jgi:hypothetical protein
VFSFLVVSSGSSGFPWGSSGVLLGSLLFHHLKSIGRFLTGTSFFFFLHNCVFFFLYTPDLEQSNRFLSLYLPKHIKDLPVKIRAEGFCQAISTVVQLPILLMS